MKIEGIYTNREGDKWEVGNITRHPFAPLAFVMAVRVKDGQAVCLHKHRLEMIETEATIPSVTDATNIYEQ